MKAALKVCNINSAKDVTKIRTAISSNEGIIACQIMKQSGSIEVVFDESFVSEENIIESIELNGYIVI